MPQFHGRCQRIYIENVEFSIEHRIYYLAQRFYSEPDARVIYIMLATLWLAHAPSRDTIPLSLNEDVLCLFVSLVLTM